MALKGILTGQRAWLWQRLSAFYLLVYVLGLSIALVLKGWPADYPAWRALWANPWFWSSSALALFASLLHAWVGLRDIILDYVKPFLPRLLALSGLALALAAMALWGLKVLLSVILV